MKAWALVRRRVLAGLVLLGEVEKPRPGDLRTALENALEEHPTRWIEQNDSVREQDLGDAERSELEIIVDATVFDLRAVLRGLRGRRDQARGRSPLWRTGYSPEWWDSAIERLFGSLRHCQDEALLLVRGDEAGDRGYLDPRHVKKVLEQIADRDLLPGEHVTMDVPTGFYDHGPLLSFATTTFVGREGGRADCRGAVSRLRRLSEVAEQVRYVTGCHSWEALGFLLCDEVPWVPALQIDVGRPPGCINVLIRHPEISLQVINDGIKEARRELGVEHGRPPDLRTGWPPVVYEFVEEWRKEKPGRLRWPQIYDAFAARYPDAPYVRGKKDRQGLASMRETYRQERGRRENAKAV
jgi:hypothetical protein